MAVFYSNRISGDGDVVQTLPTVPKHSPAGIGGKFVQYEHGRITCLAIASTTDVMRFFKLPSGARLLDLWISSDGTSGAGAMDIGLFTHNENWDGAVIDADIFASAQTISTAIERTDVFNESAIIQHEDHGKTLWELLALGDGTDTTDPRVEYEFCGTATTDFTTTKSILLLEAQYTMD